MGQDFPSPCNKLYISAPTLCMNTAPFWDHAATQMYINMLKKNKSLNLKHTEGSKELGCRNSP